MERNTAKRTLEKLLSVCICLCMLGAMLPAQVFAEEADRNRAGYGPKRYGLPFQRG